MICIFEILASAATVASAYLLWVAYEHQKKIDKLNSELSELKIKDMKSATLVARAGFHESRNGNGYLRIENTGKSEARNVQIIEVRNSERISVFGLHSTFPTTISAGQTVTLPANYGVHCHKFILTAAWEDDNSQCNRIELIVFIPAF